MNIQDYSVPVEDRVPFAKFMAYIAQVDGKVTLDEKQAIDSFIFAWCLDEAAVKKIYHVMEHGATVKDLTSEFKNRKSCYLLIQELITLASFDGNYEKNEQRAIQEIASLCSISKPRVKQIEKWVSDGIAWRKKGVVLITPEGE